jgi:hypothetical protein
MIKIKELFKKRLKPQEKALVILFEEIKKTQAILNTVEEHVIAIARLSLIKPDRLKKESKNNKANADYLLRMVENEKEKN